MPAKSDDLTAIVQEAGRKLGNLQMTRIVGQPDMADARNLVSDIEALWQIVDPVIEAIGEYAHSNFSMPADDRDLFRDQLRGALEGNATHVITAAAHELISSYRDAADEHRADLRRVG